MEQPKEKSIIKLRLTIALAALVMAASNTWLAYHNKGINIREVPLEKLAIRFGLSCMVVAVPILSLYASGALVHQRRRNKN